MKALEDDTNDSEWDDENWEDVEIVYEEVKENVNDSLEHPKIEFLDQTFGVSP